MLHFFQFWGDFVKRLLVFGIIILGSWLVNTSAAIAAEERLIAVILTASQQRYLDIHAVFVENSKTFCGENCRIYVQTPNADTMSLRNSVRKAVALDADLILVYGPAASLAAKAESPKIPTLFADVYDPEKLELVSVKSLTGRNMTGVRGDAPVQALFKYFIEATQARTLAVLYDTNNAAAIIQKTVLEDSGKKKGVAIILLPSDNQNDQMTPLQAITSGVDGLFLADSEHAEIQLEEVLAFAAERNIPVITQRTGTAEAGAFMVLETSVAEQGEKLAEFAGQILAGRKISEIPMHKPRQVAFIVNLNVAREYGIQVPFQTLSVATRVVR